MKKQRKVEKDNRGVAIYARKSRITNKGDSIGVQFKQCADYAKKELGLDEEYEFLQYEDKGLSGYFSDRPDFQRMLHDVQDGKIKAIVCYKLDRVGRKTADLIRLMDFLEMYHVDLLICSNGINTASGLYKIFIQIFAVIAEFERDTLTERIVDNMMELAKDGRWLGGNTPTGFTVKRVKTGSGKNKSAYSYLESIPEEKAMIQKLYAVFSETRSIKKTADRMNELGYRTKIGSKFNTSTTRLLLKNPVYCVADEIAYNYFYENGGGVCADLSEFDGQHGIMAYNRTLQRPGKANQIRPMEEWIVSVGKHPGIIAGSNWVRVQAMLEVNKSKSYRRPRSNMALLSGLLRCSECGDYMRPKMTNRKNANGELIYTYMCSTKERSHGTVCNMKNCNGNTLDAKVIEEIRKVASDKVGFSQLLLQTKKVINDNKASYEAESLLLTKKHVETEDRIKRLVESLSVSSETSAKYVMEQIDELHRQSEQEQARISELEKLVRQSNALTQDLAFYMETIESFVEAVDLASIEEKRRLLRTIVKKLVWDGENAHVYVFTVDGEVDLPPIEHPMYPLGEDSE